MGFGTEIFFLLALGFLLLGPKKLPEIFGHIARAKAQLEHAKKSFTSDLETALEADTNRSAMNSVTQTSKNQ